MANVWHLFEYAGYAFAPKKLRSATIESHVSSLKIFHGIFRPVSGSTPLTLSSQAV